MNKKISAVKIIFSCICVLSITKVYASDFMRSTAVVDNSGAVFLNPSGLSENRNANALFYFKVDSTDKISSSEFSVQIGRVGFGQKKTILSGNYYYLSNGFSLSRFLSFGLSGIYSNNTYGLDFGLQSRIFNSLSIGASSINLTKTYPMESRLFIAGLAIRPLDFITLAVDQTFKEKKADELKASAELNAGNFRLYTDYLKDEKKFSFGISFYAKHAGVGIAPDNKNKKYSNFMSLSYDLRPPVILPGKRIAEINISGNLADSDPQFSVFGPTWTSSASIISQIQNASNNKSIDGIIISIENLRAGIGTIEEIRNAIIEARLSGKKVVCHLNNVATGEYYLACAASEIVLTPTAYWFTPGLGFEVMLYKGLFDKFGVKADFVVAGKYKGFVEPYRLDSLSNEFKENEQRVLSDWYNRLQERISISRSMTKEKVDSLFNLSSIQPNEALSLGFVDKIGYSSDITEQIWGKNAEKIKMTTGSFYRENWKHDKKIAVILLSGTIIFGESFTDILSGTSFSGSSTVCAMIKNAVKDDEIGAIVLRIQSGGGSSLASDIIWNEIKIARKKKPVIVSVGNMAASGAYYIACAADTIVANPGAVVGSIGVFAGKFEFEGLYKKLGLKTEEIKTSPNVGAFSSSRPFSDKERKMLETEIKCIYETFKDRVSKGRKLNMSAVDSISEGRIFTASQGQKNGMVDVLGDLKEAIDIAKRKANIKTEDVSLEIFPKTTPIFSYLKTSDLNQAKRSFSHIISVFEKEKIWAIAPLGMMF